jgi:hypothetical protein
MDDSLNLIPVTLLEYVKSLNHEDVAFYIETLTVDGVQLPDPYGITKSCWDNDVNKWSDISYPDIYQYILMENSSLSNVRIHVERVIGKMRNYLILQSTIPVNQVRLLDDIVVIIYNYQILMA